jgi:hypothetical protein
LPDLHDPTDAVDLQKVLVVSPGSGAFGLGDVFFGLDQSVAY